MGGKQKIGRKIARDIVDYMKRKNIKCRGYCEPFCGMLGVYKNIISSTISFNDLLAGDINGSVIEMWRSAQKGWRPPTTCSREEYNVLKTSDSVSPEKGFIAHHCSFAGKYFSGYVPDRGQYKSMKNAGDKVIDIAKKCGGIKFNQGDYQQFSGLQNYVIFCDPPYKKYNYYYDDCLNGRVVFDHDKFWDWCRAISMDNVVFVSEFDAPHDFQIVGEYPRIISFGNHTKIEVVERLYVIQNSCEKYSRAIK